MHCCMQVTKALEAKVEKLTAEGKGFQLHAEGQVCTCLSRSSRPAKSSSLMGRSACALPQSTPQGVQRTFHWVACALHTHMHILLYTVTMSLILTAQEDDMYQHCHVICIGWPERAPLLQERLSTSPALHLVLACL